MKRFKHPDNGFTHAWGPLHEASLIAAGWVEDVAIVTAADAAPVRADPEPVVLAEKRKPGRPKKAQQ